MQEIGNIEMKFDFNLPKMPLDERLMEVESAFRLAKLRLEKSKTSPERRAALDTAESAVLDSLARCGDTAKAREVANDDYRPLEEQYQDQI